MALKRNQIINPLVGFGQRAIGPYANRIGQSAYARNVNLGKPANLLTDDNAIKPAPDFDSTAGWSAIATDVFESQSIVVDDGNFAFHVNSNTTSSPGARIFKDITSLVNEGDTYEIEFRWRHVGVGAGWRAAIGQTSFGSFLVVIDDVGPADTTFVTASAQWTQPAGDAFILMRENSGSDDGGVYVDNMVLKPV